MNQPFRGLEGRTENLDFVNILTTFGSVLLAGLVFVALFTILSWTYPATTSIFPRLLYPHSSDLRAFPAGTFKWLYKKTRFPRIQIAFSWLILIKSLSHNELVSIVGLDNYIMIRAVGFGLKSSLIYMIFSLLILTPIYASEAIIHNNSFEWTSTTISISAIPEGSSKFYIVAVINILMNISVLLLLRHEFISFNELARPIPRLLSNIPSTIQHSVNHVRYRTVILTGIPQTLRCEKRLREVISFLIGADSVQNVYMCYDERTILAAMKLRSAICASIFAYRFRYLCNVYKAEVLHMEKSDQWKYRQFCKLIRTASFSTEDDEYIKKSVKFLTNTNQEEKYLRKLRYNRHELCEFAIGLHLCQRRIFQWLGKTDRMRNRDIAAANLAIARYGILIADDSKLSKAKKLLYEAESALLKFDGTKQDIVKTEYSSYLKLTETSGEVVDIVSSAHIKTIQDLSSISLTSKLLPMRDMKYINDELNEDYPAYEGTNIRNSYCVNDNIEIDKNKRLSCLDLSKYTFSTEIEEGLRQLGPNIGDWAQGGPLVSMPGACAPKNKSNKFINSIISSMDKLLKAKVNLRGNISSFPIKYTEYLTGENLDEYSHEAYLKTLDNFYMEEYFKIMGFRDSKSNNRHFYAGSSTESDLSSDSENLELDSCFSNSNIRMNKNERNNVSYNDSTLSTPIHITSSFSNVFTGYSSNYKDNLSKSKNFPGSFFEYNSIMDSSSNAYMLGSLRDETKMWLKKPSDVFNSRGKPIVTNEQFDISNHNRRNDSGSLINHHPFEINFASASMNIEEQFAQGIKQYQEQNEKRKRSSLLNPIHISENIANKVSVDKKILKLTRPIKYISPYPPLRCACFPAQGIDSLITILQLLPEKEDNPWANEQLKDVGGSLSAYSLMNEDPESSNIPNKQIPFLATTLQPEELIHSLTYHTIPINNELHQFQPTNTAFVTCKTFKAAILLSSTKLLDDESIETHYAPDPLEILWENVHVTPNFRSSMVLLLTSILLILMILWSALIAGIELISNVRDFLKILKLKPPEWMETSWWKLVENLLHVVSLTLFTTALPHILKMVCLSLVKPLVKRDEERFVFRNIFIFQVLTIYVTVFSGSIIQTLTSSLALAFAELAESFTLKLPETGGYFFMFMLIRAFFSIPMTSLIMQLSTKIGAFRSAIRIVGKNDQRHSLLSKLDGGSEFLKEFYQTVDTRTSSNMNKKTIQFNNLGYTQQDGSNNQNTDINSKEGSYSNLQINNEAVIELNNKTYPNTDLNLINHKIIPKYETENSSKSIIVNENTEQNLQYVTDSDTTGRKKSFSQNNTLFSNISLSSKPATSADQHTVIDFSRNSESNYEKDNKKLSFLRLCPDNDLFKSNSFKSSDSSNFSVSSYSEENKKHIENYTDFNSCIENKIKIFKNTSNKIDIPHYRNPKNNRGTTLNFVPFNSANSGTYSSETTKQSINLKDESINYQVFEPESCLYFKNIKNELSGNTNEINYMNAPPIHNSLLNIRAQQNRSQYAINKTFRDNEYSKIDENIKKNLNYPNNYSLSFEVTSTPTSNSRFPIKNESSQEYYTSLRNTLNEDNKYTDRNNTDNLIYDFALQSSVEPNYTGDAESTNEKGFDMLDKSKSSDYLTFQYLPKMSVVPSRTQFIVPKLRDYLNSKDDDQNSVVPGSICLSAGEYLLASSKSSEFAAYNGSSQDSQQYLKKSQESLAKPNILANRLFYQNNISESPQQMLKTYKTTGITEVAEYGNQKNIVKNLPNTFAKSNDLYQGITGKYHRNPSGEFKQEKIEKSDESAMISSLPLFQKFNSSDKCYQSHPKNGNNDCSTAQPSLAESNVKKQIINENALYTDIKPQSPNIIYEFPSNKKKKIFTNTPSANRKSLRIFSIKNNYSTRGIINLLPGIKSRRTKNQKDMQNSNPITNSHIATVSDLGVITVMSDNPEFTHEKVNQKYIQSRLANQALNYTKNLPCLRTDISNLDWYYNHKVPETLTKYESNNLLNNKVETYNDLNTSYIRPAQKEMRHRYYLENRESDITYLNQNTESYYRYNTKNKKPYDNLNNIRKAISPRDFEPINVNEKTQKMKISPEQKYKENHNLNNFNKCCSIQMNNAVERKVDIIYNNLNKQQKDYSRHSYKYYEPDPIIQTKKVKSNENQYLYTHPNHRNENRSKVNNNKFMKNKSRPIYKERSTIIMNRSQTKSPIRDTYLNKEKNKYPIYHSEKIYKKNHNKPSHSYREKKYQQQKPINRKQRTSRTISEISKSTHHSCKSRYYQGKSCDFNQEAAVIVADYHMQSHNIHPVIVKFDKNFNRGENTSSYQNKRISSIARVYQISNKNKNCKKSLKYNKISDRESEGLLEKKQSCRNSIKNESLIIDQFNDFKPSENKKDLYNINENSSLTKNTETSYSSQPKLESRTLSKCSTSKISIQVDKLRDSSSNKISKSQSQKLHKDLSTRSSLNITDNKESTTITKFSSNNQASKEKKNIQDIHRPTEIWIFDPKVESSPNDSYILDVAERCVPLSSYIDLCSSREISCEQAHDEIFHNSPVYKKKNINTGLNRIKTKRYYSPLTSIATSKQEHLVVAQKPLNDIRKDPKQKIRFSLKSSNGIDSRKGSIDYKEPRSTTRGRSNLDGSYTDLSKTDFVHEGQVTHRNAIESASIVFANTGMKQKQDNFMISKTDNIDMNNEEYILPAHSLDSLPKYEQSDYNIDYTYQRNNSNDIQQKVLSNKVSHSSMAKEYDDYHAKSNDVSYLKSPKNAEQQYKIMYSSSSLNIKNDDNTRTAKFYSSQDHIDDQLPSKHNLFIYSSVKDREETDKGHLYYNSPQNIGVDDTKEIFPSFQVQDSIEKINSSSEKQREYLIDDSDSISSCYNKLDNPISGKQGYLTENNIKSREIKMRKCNNNRKSDISDILKHTTTKFNSSRTSDSKNSDVTPEFNDEDFPDLNLIYKKDSLNDILTQSKLNINQVESFPNQSLDIKGEKIILQHQMSTTTEPTVNENIAQSFIPKHDLMNNFVENNLQESIVSNNIYLNQNSQSLYDKVNDSKDKYLVDTSIEYYTNLVRHRQQSKHDSETEFSSEDIFNLPYADNNLIQSYYLDQEQTPDREKSVYQNNSLDNFDLNSLNNLEHLSDLKQYVDKNSNYKNNYISRLTSNQGNKYNKIKYSNNNFNDNIFSNSQFLPNNKGISVRTSAKLNNTENKSENELQSYQPKDTKDLPSYSLSQKVRRYAQPSSYCEENSDISRKSLNIYNPINPEDIELSNPNLTDNITYQNDIINIIT